MRTIDTEKIKAANSCLDVAAALGLTLTRKTGPEHAPREMAGPCPQCGGDDRLWVRAEKWQCRKCGKGGDVIALHQHATGASFREACEYLNGGELSSLQQTTDNRQPRRKYDPSQDPPPPQDWQQNAAAIIAECEAALWSESGSTARQWLNDRGLQDSTLKHFRIGYNPTSRRIADRWVYGGIVIPHIENDTIWNVVIRLSAEGVAKFREFHNHESKYARVKGGASQNLFNVAALDGQKYAFICEGEFDTMLAWQQFGDVAAAVTLGSASSRLPLRWIPYLKPIRRFYLALDNDKAGQTGRDVWRGYVDKRAYETELPQGMDITDYHQSGGDLRQWALSCLPVQSQVDNSTAQPPRPSAQPPDEGREGDRLSDMRPSMLYGSLGYDETFAGRRWLDADIARLVLTTDPAWPVTLYADNGYQPVVFLDAASIRAACVDPSALNAGPASNVIEAASRFAPSRPAPIEGQQGELIARQQRYA